MATAAAARFEGQVAVITGGADGLGKGIAHRLASEGASVVLWDFNEEKMAATSAEFTAAGFTCSTAKVDVSDFDSVQAAVDTIMSEQGRLDVLVNCAGIVGPTGVKTADVDVAAYAKVLAVNLTGSFIVTKCAVPAMLKNNYGRILLIASIAGKEGNAGMAAYSSSKAGVIGFTKAAGKEYAETGVTINALAPAVIRTAMVEAMPAEQVKYMTDKIPMKRCGAIEEVASTAAFIVSKETSFNTGFCFDLTGGRAVY